MEIEPGIQVLHEKKVDVGGLVLLITGASGGLGRAIIDACMPYARELRLYTHSKYTSLCLHKELARMNGTAIVSTSWEETLRDLEEHPKNMGYQIPPEVVKCRLSKYAVGLDVLINNAGVGLFGQLEEFGWRQISDVVGTNLMETIWWSQQAYEDMKRRGRGLIINIASTAGLKGFPYHSVYCASKFGVVGFSQALNEEGRKYGVRVSCVCPAGIETDFWKKARKDVRDAGFMKPADVAHAIADLVRLPSTITPELVVYRSPFENFAKVRDSDGKNT